MWNSLWDGTEWDAIDLYNLCVVVGVCGLFFGAGYAKLLFSLRYFTF